MAQADLDRGSERTSRPTFGEVERLYPYSQWAKRALIMSAFSYYEATDFVESRAAAERFISFYPADPDAAYAQYLIAQSWYDQINDVGRDQGNTLEALQALRVLIERYPGSDYAREAELQFDLALDHLAGKEMEVGRYYLKRGQYVAAISRFKAVVDEYSRRPRTRPRRCTASSRLILRWVWTRRRSSRPPILGYNFPGSEWYADSYAFAGNRRCAECVGEGRDLSADCAASTGRLFWASGSDPMLLSLAVRDIMLIDRLDLVFRPGLNVLTGETGAGKSILLDALGFALGHRGRADLVRTGAEQGEVVAEFDVRGNAVVERVLSEAGLPADEELIRRTNTRDGRKTAWVNDRRCSGEVLRLLSGALVEIHGQHDDRGLLDPRGHRDLLDDYAILRR